MSLAGQFVSRVAIDRDEREDRDNWPKENTEIEDHVLWHFAHLRLGRKITDAVRCPVVVVEAQSVKVTLDHQVPVLPTSAVGPDKRPTRGRGGTDSGHPVVP